MFYLIVTYYGIYDRDLRFCYVMAVWNALVELVNVGRECWLVGFVGLFYRLLLFFVGNVTNFYVDKLLLLCNLSFFYFDSDDDTLLVYDNKLDDD